MKAFLPLAACALMLGVAPAFAEPVDEAPPQRPSGSIYERISAHYGPAGRDVKQKFRDGPCKISRRWEKNGDYEETIRCKGPRR